MRPLALLFLSLGFACLCACANPVHDDAVSALGPEAPGVPPGPTHRPGQPCLTCHGGQGPASLQFSMGGTAYQNQLLPLADGGAPTSAPLVGATVLLTDSVNSTQSVTTNSAGNFYILESQWVPTFPVGGLENYPDGSTANLNHEIQVCQGDCASTSVVKESMLTQIGRDGSCADCHSYPPGPLSPGPIYLVPQ
jgi:hypothetical protein